MTQSLLQSVLMRTARKEAPTPALGPFDAILAHCHRRRYPSKTEVFRPGDPASTMYFVLSGSLSVLAEDESGQELVLTYVNPGDFVGEMGIFIQSTKREVILRTRTATELAEISYDRLHSLLEGSSARDCAALMFAIVKQISGRLLQSNRKAGRLAFMDVANRIARTLLELCQEPDSVRHPQGTKIHIPRLELARLAGCSREMAGRVIKQFESEGLLATKGKFIVLFDAP
jgi:CRP/FNR family cyclic AMP-dependent transcriptional regulator